MIVAVNRAVLLFVGLLWTGSALLLAQTRSLERKLVMGNKDELSFWGNRIDVRELELYTARSIWQS